MTNHQVTVNVSLVRLAWYTSFGFNIIIRISGIVPPQQLKGITSNSRFNIPSVQAFQFHQFRLGFPGKILKPLTLVVTQKQIPLFQFLIF